MDRFKKEIKRKLNEETKQEGENADSFERWFAENEDRLGGFIKDEPYEPNSVEVGGSLRAKKISIITAICLAFILAVSLIFIFTFGNSRTDDFTFDIDMTYNCDMTEEDWVKVEEQYDFVKKIDVTSSKKSLLNEDDSLVSVNINGRHSAENDYYIITAQIEYNSHYNFEGKSFYYSLSNNVKTSEYSVSYAQTEVDKNGLYVYLLRLEADGVGTVYMEIHCFENDISYILNEFI